ERLVGSEMCIRDSLTRVPLAAAALAALALLATLIAFSGNGRAQAQPVLD
ncbi:MFS transporter, partial [Pseudomonas aeruginosa]|nr:MFS transporter [Pseudomonas aeruginosa]